MQRQTILHTLLFVIFFSIGASVLSVSVLSRELLQYYQNRKLLGQAQVSVSRLETLNADYDALLQRLQNEPNMLRRIAPATLGTKPAEEDTIYPKATVEQLVAAKKVLTEDLNQQTGTPGVPGWIVRCNEPPRRFVLFVAGAFLIIISLVLFGSSGRKYVKERLLESEKF
jgi:hypothetical protein